MLMHIVMWKVIGPCDTLKTDQLAKIRNLLEGLPAKVSHVERLHVGTNSVESPYAADIVLCAEFNSLEALHSYQQHPAHLETASQVAELVSERRVIDFFFHTQGDDAGVGDLLCARRPAATGSVKQPIQSTHHRSGEKR